MAILRGRCGSRPDACSASSLFALLSNGLSVRRRRRYRITPSQGARSCSWHILLADVFLDAGSASTLATSLGEYIPWNRLPRSLRIQNTATSAISSAETPCRRFRRQWLFVPQAHAISEPFRAD